jgi:RND family efflux transporter MFP subunit
MVRKILQGLLPLLVLAGAAYGLNALLAERSGPEKQTAPPPPPLVRVVAAESADVVFEVFSQGDVRASVESRLSPRVTGSIEWVSPSFVVGGFFTQGDVLLKLDVRDYELAIIQAEARVASADLVVAREESESEVAQSEWESLGSGDAGDLVLRVPHLLEARALAAASRAELEQAHLNLERTKIRAPFDGRVRTRAADLGQVVGPNSDLATLYATHEVEVRLPVADSELEFLELPLDFRGDVAGEGEPDVVLSTRFAGKEWAWEGYIVRAEGEVDPLTRMVHLVALVQDPYAEAGGDGQVSGRPPLSLGMFVSAVIQGREVQGVVVLPRAALRAGSRVYVVDEQGRLRGRAVQVLRTQADSVVLASGVEPGELVCVSILEAPVDGMTVGVEVSEADTGRDLPP